MKYKNDDRSRSKRGKSLSSALILTISDSASRGEREDLSGPEVRNMLEEAGFDILGLEVLPDERTQIQDRLRIACDREHSHLVVTTGGTGLSPRDVTPEATGRIVTRKVPGMAEMMRHEGLKSTPRAALSRGIVGIRGSTLIVNLPGSVKGVCESLQALLPILPHALEVIATSSLDCGE